MSIPTDIAALEAAIITWATTASGYVADNVRWAQQPSPRPTGAYVELNAQAIRTIGVDWIETRNNPTPTAGAEIQRAVRGVRELVLGIQVFAGPTGRGFGAAAPLWVLHSMVTSLASDTHRDALTAVGLGFQQPEMITSIQSGLGQGIIEPRATTRLRFGCTAELIGTATFIEFVEVTDVTRSLTYEIG